MAADTKVSDGADYVFNVKKIKKVKGYLLGACGDLDLVHWFLNNFKPELVTSGHRITPPQAIATGDDFEALVVSPKRKLYLITDKLMVVPMNDFGYAATGSGQPIALGALCAGASAIGAIKAAIRHDRDTGGKVQYIKL